MADDKDVKSEQGRLDRFLSERSYIVEEREKGRRVVVEREVEPQFVSIRELKDEGFEEARIIGPAFYKPFGSDSGKKVFQKVGDLGDVWIKRSDFESIKVCKKGVKDMDLVKEHSELYARLMSSQGKGKSESERRPSSQSSFDRAHWALSRDTGVAGHGYNPMELPPNFTSKNELAKAREPKANAWKPTLGTTGGRVVSSGVATTTTVDRATQVNKPVVSGGDKNDQSELLKETASLKKKHEELRVKLRDMEKDLQNTEALQVSGQKAYGTSVADWGVQARFLREKINELREDITSIGTKLMMVGDKSLTTSQKEQGSPKSQKQQTRNASTVSSVGNESAENVDKTNLNVEKTRGFWSAKVREQEKSGNRDSSTGLGGGT